MSMYLPPIGAVFGGGIASIVASELGFGGNLAIAFMACGVILGLATWIYSPLPATNGGMFGPPARKQKWGWTSKPAKEYEDPTQRDYMTANLVGINWAAETEETDNGE